VKIKAVLPITLLMVCLSLLLSPGIAGSPSLSSELPPDGESVRRLFLPDISRAVPHDWIGPEGGTITAVVADPQDPARLYAGSWGGGVYRSVDGGGTWKRAAQGLGNLKITALAIDPQKPATLYAGTYKGKIYKSTDRGERWFPSSEGIQEDAIVYSIVIDPANARRIYTATRGNSKDGDRPWAGVVYRSEDGGGSWTPSLSNLGGADYQDWAYALEIHPNLPNILFAATHEHGPLRSKDYGQTWEVLMDGISNRATRAVVVDPRPDKSGFVYTGVWTRDGVFKSMDGGETWVMKSSGISGAQIYRMALHPGAPDTLFAGTYNMGVMRTTNGADRWSAAGLNWAGISALYASPAGGGTLFAGTDGDGLYQSRDSGQTWTHGQSGLTATLATSLALSPEDPSTYYAGLSGGGVVRSLDHGLSWSPFNENLSDRVIHALVQDPSGSSLFALSESAGLFRRNIHDPRATWQKVPLSALARFQPALEPEINLLSESGETFMRGPESPLPAEGLLAAEATAPLLSLAFAHSDPQVAYLGTNGAGVFRSSDGGATWTPAGWGGYKVWSLAVHPQDPQILYAASGVPGTVGASQDGGSTWQTFPIPGLEVFSLAISPTRPEALIAGTDDGIYRLSMGAWQQLGLDGETVIALAVHLERSEQIIAGTDQGAWISPDSGASWEPGPVELLGLAVKSIRFSPHTPELVFYTTLGNGILRVGYNR
jgi:photosystem II stability/assembly factor-like uncharacterized protein